MVKRQFCCEATRGMYEDYYRRQTGGEIPVFVGRRYQRGHGLGSILSGLFRRVVPFVKDNIRNVGRNLLKTGVNVVGDVLGGKKFKEAAKEHIPRAIKRTVEDIDWKSAHPNVKRVGPKVMRVGADIVGDVIGGRGFKEGIKRAAGNFGRQTGSGRARRRIKRRDIFA
jgi:hypothetical protein